MSITPHNPARVLPPYAAYAHAVEVPAGARTLYISGLNGYEVDGVTMPESFGEQAALVWQHLGAVLAEAGMSYDDLRRTVISRLLTAAGLAAALASTTACSEQAGPPASPRGPSTTSSQAEAVLEAVGVPSDRDFASGSFDFGDTFAGGSSAEDGRLASSSWDVYFGRDTGEVWGAGLDIFDSVEAAQRSAQKVATFWVCDGPWQPVDGIDGSDYDVLQAISCARVADDGYLAYVSASDGVVATNLTVSGPTRSSATTAVVEVWASLSETAQGAVEKLPRSAPGTG